MKRKLLSVILSALLIAPLSAAKSTDKNSERIHYRCHLRLSDNSDVVHGFVSAGKTQSEFTQALVGRLVYSADGVTGSAVETVYQCVKAEQRFKSKRARELQEKTPF